MTSVKRPDFIDSPYFVGELDNWHLKPGAPKEVVREFNQFMKITKGPSVELPDIKSKKKELTLHEAIRRVIDTYGPATVSDITEKINQQRLYMRKDGEPVPANQVSARIRKYPHMFIRENGKVYMNEKNKVLCVEAYIGGYFGTSYNAFIDLQNKVAIYKNFEDGYQIIGNREIKIDDTMIEKFRSEMDSIRIFDWDREYFALVLDGTNWSVTIKTVGGVFESSGSNAFPKNWGKFCRSVESIVMGEFR